MLDIRGRGHQSCMPPRSGVPPSSLQIPAERYLKGQPDQGPSVSQMTGCDNNAHGFGRGLGPCSQAVPAQRRQQLSFP